MNKTVKPELNNQAIKDIDYIFDQYEPVDPVDQKYADERSIIQTFLFLCLKHDIVQYDLINPPVYVTELYDIYEQMSDENKRFIYYAMQSIIPNDKKVEFGFNIMQIFLPGTTPITAAKAFITLFAQDQKYEAYEFVMNYVNKLINTIREEGNVTYNTEEHEMAGTNFDKKEAKRILRWRLNHCSSFDRFSHDLYLEIIDLYPGKIKIKSHADYPDIAKKVIAKADLGTLFCIYCIYWTLKKRAKENVKIQIPNRDITEDLKLWDQAAAKRFERLFLPKENPYLTPGYLTFRKAITTKRLNEEEFCNMIKSIRDFNNVNNILTY